MAGEKDVDFRTFTIVLYLDHILVKKNHLYLVHILLKKKKLHLVHIPSSEEERSLKPE